MKERDIIIKATNGMSNGLYVIQSPAGYIGLTNKKHATHFTARRNAREAIAKSGFSGLVWIDLNKKRKKGSKNNND